MGALQNWQRIENELLKRVWVPPKTYDLTEGGTFSSRKFKHDWLQTYSPWLTYSQKEKGAFCLYCVLFPPPTATVQGVLGAFIVRPFTKYKNMHEDCRSHAKSKWHKHAVEDAAVFMRNTPVDVQTVRPPTAHKQAIQDNREIISKIISTVAFCGTHDLPLRGKEASGGVFEDLLKFRVQSGDEQLQKHLQSGAKKCTVYFAANPKRNYPSVWRGYQTKNRNGCNKKPPITAY